MRWLTLNGSRPTNQLIREYLEKDDFKFGRTTYNKVGGAIVKFTNHFVEQFNEVDLIEPVGPKKERPTLAMATPVLEALGRHVMSKLKAFVPLKKQLADEEDRVRAAKYLGKSLS